MYFYKSPNIYLFRTNQISGDFFSAGIEAKMRAKTRPSALRSHF